jgi:CBS domain-containing protein
LPERCRHRRDKSNLSERHRAPLEPAKKGPIMLVSEILRIKGNTLYTTTPEGAVMDAVKVMADNDIGSLVVMEGGRLAGMLTFREVLAAMAKREGSLAGVRIADIYERQPLTAAPELDVMELRRTMLERHARYVPVMDGGTLQGVVSFHDVAKAVYDEQNFENRMLKSYIKDWPEEASP